MKIEFTGTVLKTEEDIRNEWNRIHTDNNRIDGFPDTYEAFRDEILAINRGERNVKVHR